MHTRPVRPRTGLFFGHSGMLARALPEPPALPPCRSRMRADRGDARRRAVIRSACRAGPFRRCNRNRAARRHIPATRRCGKYPMRSASGSTNATVPPCCSRLRRIGPIPFPRGQRTADARARRPDTRARVSFQKQIICPDVSSRDARRARAFCHGPDRPLARLSQNGPRAAGLRDGIDRRASCVRSGRIERHDDGISFMAPAPHT
ncbi:protein of unknown function [Burkholderia multivorans]